jgi:hypothetical protein
VELAAKQLVKIYVDAESERNIEAKAEVGAAEVNLV